MNTHDWNDFYVSSKDTTFFDPNYEKKYKNIINVPHIKDALDNTNDFESFMLYIRRFERINMETL
jgi:hypothetical protein